MSPNVAALMGSDGTAISSEYPQMIPPMYSKNSQSSGRLPAWVVQPYGDPFPERRKNHQLRLAQMEKHKKPLALPANYLKSRGCEDGLRTVQSGTVYHSDQPGSALPTHLQHEYRLQRQKELQKKFPLLEDCSQEPVSSDVLALEDISPTRKKKPKKKVLKILKLPQVATHMSGSLPPNRSRLALLEEKNIQATCRERPRQETPGRETPSETPRLQSPRGNSAIIARPRNAIVVSPVKALRREGLASLAKTEPRLPKWQSTSFYSASKKDKVSAKLAANCPKRVGKLLTSLRDLRLDLHDVAVSLERVIYAESAGLSVKKIENSSQHKTAHDLELINFVKAGIGGVSASRKVVKRRSALEFITAGKACQAVQKIVKLRRLSNA